MKLGKIQILKNITARESIFMVGETDFRLVKSSLFSIFQRLLSVFFRPVEKHFSAKSSIPAVGNGFFGLMETIFKERPYFN